MEYIVYSVFDNDLGYPQAQEKLKAQKQDTRTPADHFGKVEFTLIGLSPSTLLHLACVFAFDMEARRKI